MKTTTRYSAPYLFGLAVALLVLNAPIVLAQQTMEVPAPVPQSKSTLHYRPKPTPRPTPQPQVIDNSNQQNQTQVVPPQPHAEPTPEPRSQAVSESATGPAGGFSRLLARQGRISRFDRAASGCGESRYVDAQNLSPMLRALWQWAVSADLLRGGNRSEPPRLSTPGARWILVSTDGRTYATMRALLHFDEYRYGNSSGDTFEVDEVARLQCEIRPDGMHVIGSVRGTRDGDPWFRAYWHTIFIHVPG